MSVAEDIKKLLGGSIDEKLQVIEKRTGERLNTMLGADAVPDELAYITYEITLKRFNRIGQEGMQSYSQEGLAMTFPDSDFAEYADIINEWRNNNDESAKRGRFRLY